MYISRGLHDLGAIAQHNGGSIWLASVLRAASENILKGQTVSKTTLSKSSFGGINIG